MLLFRGPTFKAGEVLSVKTLDQRTAKAWAYYNPKEKVLNGFNVAGVESSQSGEYKVTFGTPMPNSQYAVVASAMSGGYIYINGNGTSSVSISIRDIKNVAFDPEFSVVVFDK